MVYRLDIDGLRAIAVCIVIFFHFGIPGFSGGFIGVDVFFVLSGYLIGSIILKQLNTHTFSFKEFYFRRIRRLFPVFVVVIIFTIIAAYFRMLPNDFKEFGQSVVASTVYLSNFLFYFESGYFDAASHLKPLLHTWSLAVEEQFYIIFPVIAWLIYRYIKRGLLPIFIALTLISLLASQLYLNKDASAVFYLYPFRAWEMFLGVCLAMNRLPQIQSTSLNTLAAVAGLAMIVIPNFNYTNSTPFPGLSALIPCVGTCILIHTGNKASTLIHRCLMNPIPVFLGKISYSLYLWHWPVFVLFMYDNPNKPSLGDIAFMSIITFTAATLTWKLIETPYRNGRVIFSKTPIAVFTSTFVSSIILISSGYFFHITQGIPTRFDSETISFADAANDLFGDLTGCQEKDNNQLKHVEFCEIGDPFNAEEYTLIWSDSHGGAFKKGLETALNKQNNAALLAWTGGCPPVFGIDKDESSSSSSVDSFCLKRNNTINHLIQTDKRINAVVLIGRWSYYLNGEGLGNDLNNKISLWPAGEQRQNMQNQNDFFIDQLNKTIEQLSKSQLQVFVVEQVPEFSNYNARVVALGMINKSISTELKYYTSEPYDSILKRQGDIQKAIQLAQDKNQIHILKTHQFFCGEKLCSLIQNGKPAYFDNNHISSTAAENISSMFAPLTNYINKKD